MCAVLMDASHRELSRDGLGSIVALLVGFQIIVLCIFTGTPIQLSVTVYETVRNPERERPSHQQMGSDRALSGNFKPSLPAKVHQMCFRLIVGSFVIATLIFVKHIHVFVEISIIIFIPRARARFAQSSGNL